MNRLEIATRSLRDREFHLDMVQGSPEWFEAHTGRLTASGAKKLLTPSGSLSSSRDEAMAHVVAERLGLQAPEFGSVSTEWMERGSGMESEARDWFAFESDLELTEVGIVTYHHCGASPDAIYPVDFKGLMRIIPCEFKCPKPSTLIKWKMAGGLPNDHKQQVHFQLAVCDAPFGWFVAYHPDIEPLMIKVVRDDYTDKMLDAIDMFNAKTDSYLEAMK